jgi:hypothetical protein
LLFASPVPTATTAALPLAVEVGCGDRRAEAVARGKVPGVEVGAPSRRIDCLSHRLPERYERETVDAGRRPRALVGHYLVS